MKKLDTKTIAFIRQNLEQAYELNRAAVGAEMTFGYNSAFHDVADWLDILEDEAGFAKLHKTTQELKLEPGYQFGSKQK